MTKDLSTWLLDHYGQEQMRPGLDRIKMALKDLLPAFDQTKIVIIAGTNGKGETTLRLSDLLKRHHHYTWTSPHIERLTERMRNEKGEISFDLLENLIQECHEKVVLHHFELTYYEFLFLVFCTWASRSHPEFLLLEVGLGGRLDAVNVFNADLVLLPSISRDHQEFLGKRLDQILKEKLGTMRKKSTLIHFLQSEYLNELTDRYVKSIGAESIALKTKIFLPEHDFTLRNSALAHAAYSKLTLGEVLPEIKEDIPGFLEHRGESFRGKNEFIFFGSHNIDGLRKLIQFLHSGTYNFSRPPYDGVIVAFSRRNPDDLRVMLKMLNKAKLGKILVTGFLHPKAAPKDVVEVLSREEGSEFVQDIEEYIKGQPKGQRMLVTGSYYFLGHFKSLPCCR